VRTETLATAMFEGIDFKGEFLKQKITRQLFPEEHRMPSRVIDRGSMRTWTAEGSQDAFARAKTSVDEIVASYKRPDLPDEQVRELRRMVENLARRAGMDRLPDLKI